MQIQAPGPTSRPGRPLIDPFEPSGNDGFDNKDGELIVRYNDQIEDPETGKVFVTKLHYGAGEFGHVYKVALLGKTPSPYFAMKISKNEDDAIEQFNCEAQILNYVFFFSNSRFINLYLQNVLIEYAKSRPSSYISDTRAWL